eukprot:gene3070-3349_t
MHPPMLFGGHASWGTTRIWGSSCGVLSAFFSAGAFISIRFVGKQEPAIIVALYFHMCTLAISLLPLAVGYPQAAVLPGWRDCLLLLAVAVSSFTAQLCLTRGFQLESASKASGLNFSQVVYSYIFGIIFFSEHLSLFGVLGTLLIAAGMALVTARSGTIQPSDKTDTARNMAAAGAGSRVFQRSHNSSSFLARAGSYQRLVAADETFPLAAAAAAETAESAEISLVDAASSCNDPAQGVSGHICVIQDPLSGDGSIELTGGNAAVLGGGLSSAGGVAAPRATKSLVIAHGRNRPKDIQDLMADMAHPITKVLVWSARDFQEIVDPNKVELVDLADPSSCIRNVTSVSGGLVIYDDGSIPDLSALFRLRQISGPFYVYGTNKSAALTSLDGLQNLEVVGSMNIAHSKLTSLAGLTKLRLIQSDLIIWDNRQLTSLEGINNAVSQLYTRLWIERNPLLTDLNGLQRLTKVFDDVVIKYNENLATLGGLGALQDVKGELVVMGNGKLTTTRHLAGLTAVGELQLRLDSELLDLAGFSKLTSVPGDLQIYRLPLITSLAALSNLTAVGLNLIIGDMDGLTTLQGLMIGLLRHGLRRIQQ